MATAGETAPNVNPDLEFEVTYESIKILEYLIKKDYVALEKWKHISNHLVKDPGSCLRIQTEADTQTAVRMSLLAWKSEQGSNATLQSFVGIVRASYLNNLGDAVENHAIEIQEAQQVETWPGLSCLDDSIPFGMKKTPPKLQRRQAELDELHGLVLASGSINMPSGWTQLTNVCGIGGVGKTTLVKMYVNENLKEFNGNVIWINASAPMKEQFIRAVQHIGITPLTNRTSHGLAQRLYRYFIRKKKKCLFIFDDVEDFKEFEPFRPSDIPQSGQIPYILVTSRTTHTFSDDDRIMRLGVFSETNALEFIAKQLRELPETSKLPKLLSDKLGRLPLALQQALPVVKYLNIDQRKAVETFLKMYDASTKDVLDDNSELLKEDGSYRETVYRTFTLTVHQISKHDHGDVALRLLEYMAFLYNEDIQDTFLVKLVQYHPGEQTIRASTTLGRLSSGIIREKSIKFNDGAVAKAIQLLKKFSLIHRHVRRIEIHRLLQDVVRINLSQDQEVKVLRNIMMFMESTREDQNLGKQVVLHGTHVVKYARQKLAHQFQSLQLKMGDDQRRLQKVMSQLRETGKSDTAQLIHALVEDDKIALAVMFLNSSKMPVSDYLETQDCITTRKPVDTRIMTFLQTWLGDKLNQVFGKEVHLDLAKYLIKFLPYLNTKISLDYFMRLLGDEYKQEDVESVLRTMQAQSLLLVNSINLDPVVKYAFSSVANESTLEIQVKCATLVNNCLADTTAGEEFEEELARHGLSLLETLLSNNNENDSTKLDPTGGPADFLNEVALKICIFVGNRILSSLAVEKELYLARQFGFVIDKVFDMTAHNASKQLRLRNMLVEIQNQLFGDVVDYAKPKPLGSTDRSHTPSTLTQASAKPHLKDTIGTMDLGGSEQKVESDAKDYVNVSTQTLAALLNPQNWAKSQMLGLQSEQSEAQVKSYKKVYIPRSDLLKIREIVLQDPVAIDRWSRIVDYVIIHLSDAMNIKRKLHHGDVADAVLTTLQIWKEHSEGGADLLQVLQELGLNNLAENISSLVANRMASPSIEESPMAKAGMAKAGTSSAKSDSFMPNLVLNFVERESKLKELHELVTRPRGESKSSFALLTSLYGLGGIGKTTLARRYVDYFKERFAEAKPAVFWIESETSSTLRMAFRHLAKSLGLPEFEKLHHKILVHSIFERLHNQTCLFVFDNVTEYDGPNGISDFLPHPSLGPQHYVLVTSRRVDLLGRVDSKDRILQLDVLTEGESDELIQKLLPGSSSESRRDLFTTFGRLPLALQQAIVYISCSKDMHQDESEAIKCYLQKFNDNTKKLLKRKPPIAEFDGVQKTVYSTWQTTMATISKHENGQVACTLLRVMSYMNPHNIDLDYISTLDLNFTTWSNLKDKVGLLTAGFMGSGVSGHSTSKKDESESEKAVAVRAAAVLLNKYSMVVLNNGVISMHPLVQQVVRLTGANAEVDEVVVLLRLTAHIYKYRHTDTEQCVMHGMAVLPFYKKYALLQKYFPDFEQIVLEQKRLIE